MEIQSGSRFTLAHTGETIQLVRPVLPAGDWLASVVYPYSAQRDLITRPSQWADARGIAEVSVVSLVSRFGPEGVTISPAEIEQMAEPEIRRYDPSSVADRYAPHGTFAAPVVLEESPAEIVAAADVWLPYNAVTGAQYRGGNILRLVSAELEAGYGPGGWAGFKQWLSVGRVVHKGEHGTACITVIGDRTKGEDQPAEDGKPGARRGGGVRGFRVFHFDQTTELVEIESEPAVIVRDPGEDMADRWNESQ